MILTVVSSIIVVGALKGCALYYSGSDLKVAQMNMQRSLVRELILYKF